MIKRVNSTGRRRITRDMVSIEVFDGNPRSFDAVIDLKDFDVPDDAEVALEATCAGSNTILRFEWGTVGNLTPSPQRLLTDLHGENVFFSMKIIDRKERFGRILGLAENIRPIKGGVKTATGRRGILPVEKSDLGNELWRLDFRTQDVFLLVNDRIPELADRVRFDASVFSLIYPSIIRQILVRALDEEIDEEEEADKWPILWIRFARRLHPEKLPPPPSDDVEDRQDWVEEIVSAFCEEHSLKEKFQQSLGAAQSWEDPS
jgi:hypothetical protein